MNQDYTKHYTLCKECDQRLGDSENYLSLLVKGTHTHLAKAGIRLFPNTDAPVLSGVDRALMSRALWGIALKLHLSPAQMYARYRMSPGDEHAIAAAIRSDDYPADEFAILGYKLVNTVVAGANARATLFMSLGREMGGIEVHIHMAGWRFVLFRGRAARWRKAQELPPGCFLGQARYWTIGVVEWIDEPELSSAEPELRSVARQINAEEMCPCGLDLRFGECCSGRWLPIDTKWTRR